jgi:predicted kinase
MLVAGNDQESLARLRRWEADEATRLLPVFDERLHNGRIREGHGDLHLANVADIDGRTTVFDCIDFNAALRWIDVISDLAFMVMDLLAHGQPRLAHRLLNGYLESGGDYDGVRVLRYHIAYRALVRAKVVALRASQAGTSANDAGLRRYLALALAQTRPSAPVLMITHGPSGTGKTTLTQGLLEATGAVRIRADVERKRLFGLHARAHSGSALSEGLYSAETTGITYARLLELAQSVLDGGRDVILDATFLRRAQRDAAHRVAAAKGLRFLVLDFNAVCDPDQLRQRLRERAVRGDDASEADTEVLEAQLHSSEPLERDERTWAWQVPPARRGSDNRLHVDWSTLRRRLGTPH